MGPFDIAELVTDVIESYKPTCEHKKIAITGDTLKLNGPALGNPDRIMQVLSNLVNNAVKFSGTNDTIVISARREAVAPSDPESPPIPATNVNAWAPTDPESEVAQDFVRVDVADSGPGMSDDLRDKLFEKFAQGEGGKRTSGVLSRLFTASRVEAVLRPIGNEVSVGISEDGASQRGRGGIEIRHLLGRGKQLTRLLMPICGVVRHTSP